MPQSPIDMARLSSKGQVVIPGDIRESLGLEEGTKFVVWSEGNMILFKKVGKPSITEIDRLFADSRKRARQLGLKKSDVAKIIQGVRRGV